MMTETKSYSQPNITQSHTGLWVTITIAAAVVIFSVVLAITVYVGINKVKDNGPTPARFYLALQEQNFALAYAYLDSHATVNNQQLDQQSFIQQMAQFDATNGPVTAFGYEEKQNGSNVTVKVHRGNQNYEVHLQLKQVDSRWLITAIDKI